MPLVRIGIEASEILVATDQTDLIEPFRAASIDDELTGNVLAVNSDCITGQDGASMRLSL